MKKETRYKIELPRTGHGRCFLCGVNQLGAKWTIDSITDAPAFTEAEIRAHVQRGRIQNYKLLELKGA